MGPTSQSGFYNGVSAPSGRYTIYLEKSTNGPSIISVNDDNDLVFKTNRIFSTNFTSKEECLEYIANDNSSICQRLPVEPIVTDGLVLNLDAKQVSSFSRQTTNPTWRDLSGENFTGNLENGPGFSEDIDKISFDGANDYGDLGIFNPLNGASSFTISLLFRPENSTQVNGSIPSSFLRKWSAGTPSQKKSFSVQGPGGRSFPGGLRTLINGENGQMLNTKSNSNLYQTNEWVMATSRWNGGNPMSYFRNDIDWGVGKFNRRESPSVVNSTSSERLIIAARWSGGDLDTHFEGSYNLILVYNRALSDGEIQKNYLALKNRIDQGNIG